MVRGLPAVQSKALSSLFSDNPTRDNTPPLPSFFDTDARSHVPTSEGLQMVGTLREQALALLAEANNHGDLAVKVSSLKQAKDVLLYAKPPLAAELFPDLVQLHSSPESLVRKALIELIEEVGLKATENLIILMPILMTFLKDSDSTVTRKSITSGTNIFRRVLEELSSQFHQCGIVERWLNELWTWMVKFKDTVFGIMFEAGAVRTKLRALKFLETYILLFTSDANNSIHSVVGDFTSNRQSFNISWVVSGHPVLDPLALTSEANRFLGLLVDLLQSASNLCGSLTISIINCLASIARKRPVHYSSVLSTLLDFNPKIKRVKGGRTPSIQYSLRTAFLGFLQCTHPGIIECRERLLSALQAMNAGDVANRVIQNVDRTQRNNRHASQDAELSKFVFVKDEQPSNPLNVSGDLLEKSSATFDNKDPTTFHDVAFERICCDPNTHAASPVRTRDSWQNCSVSGLDLNPTEQMIAIIGALIAEGERALA